jgi:hypothetical protein
MWFMLIIHLFLQNMTSSKRPASSSPAFESPIQSSSKRGRRDGSAASVSDWMLPCPSIVIWCSDYSSISGTHLLLLFVISSQGRRRRRWSSVPGQNTRLWLTTKGSPRCVPSSHPVCSCLAIAAQNQIEEVTLKSELSQKKALKSGFLSLVTW